MKNNQQTKSVIKLLFFLSRVYGLPTFISIKDCFEAVSDSIFAPKHLILVNKGINMTLCFESCQL